MPKNLTQSVPVRAIFVSINYNYKRSKMKPKPSFYAVIPATVRYDNKLGSSEKLFYAEITAMSEKEGYCWASNSYFSELYSVSKNTITRWVSNLKDNGHVIVSIKRQGKQIVKREIYPIQKIGDAYPQKSKGGTNKNNDTPTHKNGEDNTTSNNTTSNNIVSDLSDTEHDALEVCEYLLSSITDSDPNHRYNSNPPNLHAKSWVKEVDRAIRLDGRSKDDLKHIVYILFFDDNEVSEFWRSNVESGKKLRSQFDKIRGQLQRLPKFKQNNHDQFVDKLFA